MSEHRGDLAAHRGERLGMPVGLRQLGEPAGERRAARTGRLDARTRGAPHRGNEGAQQRRHAALGGLGADRGQVEGGGDEQRLVEGAGGVEQGEAVGG
nr:hypothetical protein [Frankia sp. QA3]